MRRIRLFPLINLRDIFEKHHEILKRDANFFNLYIPFYAFPIVFSLFLLKFVGTISPKMASPVAGILAILGGFLFNSLLILLDEIKKEKSNNQRNDLKLDVLNHTFISVLYVITTIIIGIMFMLLIIFFSGRIKGLLNEIISHIFSFSLYYIYTKIGVVFLLILKRLFILFTKEMENL